MKELPLIFARALADPTRQQIMDACCCAWLSVNEIVDKVNVGQPTVSHHLAILRDAGLVHVRQQGKHSYYTLNQENIVKCCGVIVQAFAPDLSEESE